MPSAALLAASLSFAAAPVPRGLPPNVVILSTKAAPGLLQQCSRPSIEKPEGFWLPSASDIWELESRLTVRLNRTNPHAALVELTKSYRQYAGVVTGGRRVIYLNVVPKQLIEHASEVGRKDLWRTEPMIVCDGGPDFWGVVYDVETKSFGPLHANGQA